MDAADSSLLYVPNKLRLHSSWNALSRFVFQTRKIDYPIYIFILLRSSQQHPGKEEKGGKGGEEGREKENKGGRRGGGDYIEALTYSCDVT